MQGAYTALEESHYRLVTMLAGLFYRQQCLLPSHQFDQKYSRTQAKYTEVLRQQRGRTQSY